MRWQSLLGHDPALEGLCAWIEHGLNHLARGGPDSFLTPYALPGTHNTIRFTLMRHWGGDGHLLT